MAVRRIKVLLACLVVLAAVCARVPASGQSQADNDHSGQRTAPPSSHSDERELEPVAVPPASKLAMQFYRGNNWLWVLNVLVALLVPGVLAFSGFSARLRNLASETWADLVFHARSLRGDVFSGCRPARASLVVLRRLCASARLRALESNTSKMVRRFGYSAGDLNGRGVCTGMGSLSTPARSPKRWWVYTTLLSVPFLFAGMLIKPIWIDPLFNRFGPMKNKALEQKILSLAGKAGIEGSRVFEVEKSVDTKAVNAYVTGVFATKRIVLWDTLLAKLDEKEVLHVMGHEMGHYVKGHVVRSIVLSSVLTLIGLFPVDWCGRRVVARYSDRLGFDRLSDVASVPLLLMLLEVAHLVLSPAALAYSRIQEHEADKFALELTHDNHSGARSFVKLQEENLSNPRPGPIYKFFRSSHPSIGERIDFCNSYRPWLKSDPPPASPESIRKS